MDIYKIVFSGSGGQGIITAAIIFAEATVVYNKLHAIQVQSYGPEARGGATRSDVIISDEKINYPKVSVPNLLVCLTQESYNKFSNIVMPGGIIITDLKYVVISKSDATQLELPMYDTVVEKVGNPICFNTCMLGAVVKISNLVKVESIIKVFENKMPQKFIEMNKKALKVGMELV
jgi:2-oxoglutarate ferredoxin oxidoreductase subunit gamma